MAACASSANMSMILTPPAQLTDSRLRRRLAAPAATGAKASHNGHCVTLEPCPRYNMSHQMTRRGRWHGHCLYNYQTRHHHAKAWVQPKGEGKKLGIRRKHGFG